MCTFLSQEFVEQVTQETVRTVEIPVPVEQIVEKVIERVEEQRVPVHREEHITIPIHTTEYVDVCTLPPPPLVCGSLSSLFTVPFIICVSSFACIGADAQNLPPSRPAVARASRREEKETVLGRLVGLRSIFQLPPSGPCQAKAAGNNPQMRPQR